MLRYPKDGKWEDAGGWSDRGPSGSSAPEEFTDMHLERVEAKVDDDVGKLFINVKWLFSVCLVFPLLILFFEIE